jgi:hypothetical protein
VDAAEEGAVLDKAVAVLGDEGGAEEVDGLRRKDLQKEAVRGKRKWRP